MFKNNSFKVAAVLAATTTPIALTSGTAVAESFGYIGANVSYGSALIYDDLETFGSFPIGLEGAYAFTLGNGATAVVDALVHFDSYDPDAFDNEDLRPQYQASAHYLQPLNDKLILGGFVGYGYAPFEDDNERYQVGFVGGSMYYAISNSVALFGQAGYGTSFDSDAMSSAGFYNGFFVRAGADYSGFDFATIRAEAEYARTEMYEDDDEPGEMWTIALTGESPIGAVDNLYVYYGARFASFNAVGDSDWTEETTITVGLKYMFGGATPERFTSVGYVGAPYLPLRGSFWTPSMN